jgi:recombination protein RecT
LPGPHAKKAVVTPPRDASTVIIARDGEAGVEVYMLRRSSRSPVVPDAYVFPGGTIDNNDRSPQARMRIAGEWRPAEPAFTYAAIRETFEECGILFSVTPIDVERLRAARTLMLEGKRSFSETLIDLDARIDARAVRYFSRWITPSVVPHRFDARFFVGRVPEGQTPETDSFETYDGRWVRPADMIEQALRNDVQVIFPTYKHLERIRSFATVDDLLSFADTKKTIPVTPHVAEGTTFLLPPTLEDTW